MITNLTTLLMLLYPPLKGFSQIKNQDIRVYISHFHCLSAPPRGLKLSAFEMVTYSRVSKILHQRPAAKGFVKKGL